ncbi:MAG TPA: DUF488 domain-containing protein [Tepidisphaeraceae bacterium]|jgi:uncharacterized protein YeaO (DUF488 family)
MLQIKRVYEPVSPTDGQRILVERLWPRGTTKAEAAVDLWLKDAAPSPELRKWFAHDPAKWPKFKERYWKELKAHPEAVEQLRRADHDGTATLVYAAHDEEHNGALALQQFLTGRQRAARKAGPKPKRPKP